MKLAKLTTNGRVTIPKPLREKYNLTQGRQVRFEVEQDGIKIIPLVTPEEIKTNIGFLGLEGNLLKLLKEEKKKERGL